MNVRTAPSPPPVPGYETEALAHALHGDPFRVLGPHETPAGRVVRAFLPSAESAEVLRRSDRARIGRLEHFENGLFQGIVSERAPYLLRVTWPGGVVQETEDSYSYGPLLGDIDLHLFSEGPALQAGACARRQRDDHRRRARHALRRVGAECRTRRGDR